MNPSKAAMSFKMKNTKQYRTFLLLLKNAKMPLDAMKITQDKSLIEQYIFYKKKTMTS